MDEKLKAELKAAVLKYGAGDVGVLLNGKNKTLRGMYEGGGVSFFITETYPFNISEEELEESCDELCVMIYVSSQDVDVLDFEDNHF